MAVKAFAKGGVFGAAEVPRRFATGGVVMNTTTVMPAANEQTVTAGSSQAGAVYNLSVNVTPPAGASRQTAMQWGAEAGRQMQHAVRRNG
jgi:hypothetical protein